MTRVPLELGAEPMLLRGVTVLDLRPVEQLAARWGGSREARANSRSIHRAKAVPAPLSVAPRMVRS